MESNTHMAVGIASSFMILQPNADIKEIVLGTTLAIVGSLVSDIDIRNSKANKAINKITWIIGVAGIASIVLDYLFKLGVYQTALNDLAIMRMIVAISLFSVVVMFTKMTSHRSFSHSIIGIIAFYIPVLIIFGEISKYFLIAMLSHIIIDLFNRKKVLLFYPHKKGICFKLCYSNGTVNKVLLYVGISCIVFVGVKSILEFYQIIV